MPDRLADLLMDSDVGMEIRFGVLDVVGRLVDGSGLREGDLVAKAGIPLEHAMAIRGDRRCRLSMRSVAKVMALFGIRLHMVAE